MSTRHDEDISVPAIIIAAAVFATAFGPPEPRAATPLSDQRLERTVARALCPARTTAVQITKPESPAIFDPLRGTASFVEIAFAPFDGQPTLLRRPVRDGECAR